MGGFTCSHCGRWYRHEKNLERHVRSSHTSQPPSRCDQCGKSFSRADNLQRHMRNSTGRGVATAVAAATTVPAPAAVPRSRLQFTLQHTRRGLRGDVEQFTVNMKEAKRLSTLKKLIAVFKPAMVKFQQEHLAYKFQVVVSIVFHNAVDPAVVTQPPVVLTSEMVVVYADAAPPLNDVNRQLLNFIEVYEQNGSGWVFSNFASLQLDLL